MQRTYYSTSASHQANRRESITPIYRHGLSRPDINTPFNKIDAHNLGTTMPLQAKLTIGSATDKYEVEADQVAEQVMAMPDTGNNDAINNPSSILSNKQNPELIQKQAVPEEEEEEEELIQAKSHGSHSKQCNTPELNSLINGRGNSLAKSTRNFFEPRIGFSLENIKIHTDSNAAQAAKSINARAFTHKNNIVFGSGEYAPNTQAGKKLLAHELTHTIQQGAVSRKIQRKTNSPGNISIQSASATILQREVTRRQPAVCGPDFNRLPTRERNEFFEDDGTNEFCTNRNTITVDHDACWIPGCLTTGAGHRASHYRARLAEFHHTWYGPWQRWGLGRTSHPLNVPRNGVYFLQFRVTNHPDPRRRKKLRVISNISEP